MLTWLTLVPWQPTESAGHRRGFIWGLVGLLLFVSVDSSAGGAPPRRSNRNYSLIARQQRQGAIAAIRKEIATAKQVLEKLQTQSGASQSDLQAAASQLAAARKEAETAEQEDSDMHRKLREIEERVLSNQPVDSEYGRQSESVETARTKLDAEMHRVLGLESHPEATELEGERMRELSALSTEQRARLNADAGYSSAREQLLAEQRKLDAVEKRLLAADAEWKNAVDEHRELEAQERDKHASQRSTAADVSQAKAQVLNERELTAGARAAIADGERRLRQLGVQP